ncbi:hypothetical protein HY745_06585, partial [Candidatus Desantisbacteria bacterium]|nr:hypothetical protein [Candidatus Desantisbacteria bacterium]
TEKSKHTNPHWKGFYCMSCHEKPPLEGQKAVIRFGGNINYTCMWCHGINPTSWADVHPVNIEVITSEIMKVPKEFPLENNKLTCITCHDVRLQTKMDKEIYRGNRQFLRVIPYYPSDENRSKSCFQCHIQQQFDMLNAHDQIDDQGEMVEDSCKYCHIATPDRDTEGLQNIDPSVANLSALCFRCHSDGPHPGKVNHLMKIPSEKLSRKVIYEKKYDVVYPLDGKGDIFCATCHNPHEIGIVKSLRANKGADADRRARLPIDKGFLCFTCHDKDKDASLQQFMSK